MEMPKISRDHVLKLQILEITENVELEIHTKKLVQQITVVINMDVVPDYIYTHLKTIGVIAFQDGIGIMPLLNVLLKSMLVQFQIHRMDLPQLQQHAQIPSENVLLLKLLKKMEIVFVSMECIKIQLIQQVLVLPLLILIMQNVVQELLNKLLQQLKQLNVVINTDVAQITNSRLVTKVLIAVVWMDIKEMTKEFVQLNPPYNIVF